MTENKKEKKEDPYEFIKHISYNSELGQFLSTIFPENFPWRIKRREALERKWGDVK